MHVCRGNWTPDESVALAGDYAPLLDTLRQMRVGAYLLELATPRAGEMDLLRALPDDARIGVGVVNQKDHALEPQGTVGGADRARDLDVRARERVVASRLWFLDLCRQPDLLVRPRGRKAPAHRGGGGNVPIAPGGRTAVFGLPARPALLGPEGPAVVHYGRPFKDLFR